MNATMNATLTQWQPWLELLVKSVIVLAVAGGWCAALRKTATGSAAMRHLIWSLALAALLALPWLSRAMPAWHVPVLATAAAPIKLETTTEATLLVAQDSLLNVSPEAEPQPAVVSSPAFDWALAVWLVWLMGVALVVARLALGAWRMRRIVQASERLTNYHWSVLANGLTVQLALPAHVELYLSPFVSVPVTWGVWRPRVILPLEASSWSLDWQRIVLLHEFAHIKRRDCLTQMLSNAACALYWFNPLVWQAARQMRVERELACDDCVLAVGTRATDYASCLVAIARSFNVASAPAIAVGMACSELESRVRTMLDPAIERRWLSARRQFVLVVLAVALLLPLSALQAVSKAASVPALAAVVEPEVAEALELVAQAPVPPSPPAPPVPPVPVVAVVDPVSAPDPVAEVEAVPEVEVVQDKAQGLSAEDLVQLKTHNITPDYIEAIRQAGFPDLSVRQIVELKVHDITAATIRELRALAGDQLSLREIVRIKVSGLTAAYLTAMKQAGLDNAPIHQLTQMKLVGVTPEYIAELKRAGLENLTASQLAQLKAMGVTESYVQQAKSWGLANLNVSQIVRLKAQGVTPDDAQQFKALGFDNPSLEGLLRLKTHGVTPDFIKEMRALGFDKLTLDEAVKFRIHGVTPEYVRQMRAAGFKNISSNELLKLKIQGLDAILLKK